MRRDESKRAILGLRVVRGVVRFSALSGEVSFAMSLSPSEARDVAKKLVSAAETAECKPEKKGQTDDC